MIGLIRFLPFDTALPGLGAALAAAGIISTFYGVAIGINRSNPKTVLAYSSVSQMGVIATLLGMGLATANTGVTLAAGFYAAPPCTGEGGLVSRDRHRVGNRLAQPVAHRGSGGDRSARPRGLTFYGRVPGEAVVKPFIGEGVGIFAALSSAGTALLMLYFIDCLIKARAAKRWRARAGRSDAPVARHGIRGYSRTSALLPLQYQASRPIYLALEIFRMRSGQF